MILTVRFVHFMKIANVLYNNMFVIEESSQR